MSKQLNADAEGDTSELPLLCGQFTDYSSLPVAAVEGTLHIVRHVNAAFCSLVGKSKEELIGKPFAKTVSTAERWLPALDRIHLTGVPETHIEPEHGEPHPLYWLFSLWLVHAADGRPVGIMIQGMGTTDFQQRATEMNQALMLTAVRYHQLKEKDDRLKVQLQAAINEHASVSISNTEGNITLVNDNFCALSKYSREELLGQDHRIVNSGFHPKEFIGDLWRTISQGKVWKGEFKNRAKDGTFYWLDTTIVPFLDAAGKPFQYVAIQSDITARKNDEIALLEAQRNAEHANRAKDEFLAVLSHELRTPLTPVLATVSEMEAQEDLPPEVRRDMSMVRRNVELETTLINDLLDVTRIISGKLVLHLEPVDAHSCLRSAVEICRGLIDAKELHVSLDLGAEQHYVRADPVRLHQVFWNLLRNAVKFTVGQGRISICTSNVGKKLKVQIADTGVGIEPEVIPRIFNAFEQGGQTKTRRFGGLGLGLKIAKTVMDLHHGRITAFSEGKDKGSTFTVELATIAATPKRHARPITSPIPEPLPRILLVEDDGDTLQILSKLLQRHGYEVTPADCVRRGLELSAEGRFDIVISDLGLPDGSGLDLMRQVKALHGLHGIALSGYGTDEDLRQSRDAGFDQHLIKPVDFNALRTAIQRITGTRPIGTTG